MSTLRVTFPRNWPGWSVPEYNLTSVQAPRSSAGLLSPPRKSITVSVDAEAHTDYSSDTPVFRAELVDAASARQGKPAAVVLKFAMREDLVPYLAEEAGVYNGALAPLQGKAIPRCYGLYVGSGECGQIACLVLEHWGECLHQPFDKLSLDIRMRILERLGEIHRQGLLHGDFAERNVLELNGDIRIIDFDQTEYHDCDCDMNFRPGEKLPDAEEFGCEQLWEVCRSDMRIWDVGMN